MQTSVTNAVSKEPKILPKKGDTVAVKHTSNRHETKPKIVRMDGKPDVLHVTAVYLDPRTVKVSSGDVWQVQPCSNSTAKWETVPY